MAKKKEKTENTMLASLLKEDEEQEEQEEQAEMSSGGEAVASQSDNPHLGDISRGGRLALTGIKFRGVR